MHKRIATVLLFATTASLILAGCKQSANNDKGEGTAPPTAAVKTDASGAPLAISKDAPPITVEIDGEQWTTSTPGPIGDPRAVKGGEILSYIPNWPENLRIYGTGANTYLNSIIESMCYESLCGLHPESLETVPGLASHWRISDDNMTFTFRINPEARWADGKPIVAEDVVATYRLIQDDSLKDPMTKQALHAINEPKALSERVVQVTCKEKHWRNFMTFAALKILPAHEIADLSGDEFLKKYQFSYPAVSGPYLIEAKDIKKNESISLTRREDYWGWKDPMNTGLYNFDKIRFFVNANQRNAFDQACNGELDFHAVYTAKWWVEELVGVNGKSPLDQINKGHLVAQKVYTFSPEGIQGLVFNMRKPPFDDARVRKAIAHLYNRRTMLEKFAYSEYEPLKSYYPGATENPDNKVVEYDPEEALRLLTEAGYTERDTDGVLLKEGKRLVVKITYRTEGFEKYYTTFKEDCRKVGVGVKLNLIDPTAHWKVLQERTFEVASSALTGGLFPNPQTHWHSRMADQTGSNNFAGFKNEEADQIIEQYNEEFDMAKRQELLRQLDGVVYELHPYALEWYIPCQRIIYWNKFGTPETVFSKYGDWREVFSTWWIDRSKVKALLMAKDSGATLPVPERILKPWSSEKPAEVAAAASGESS